jgi:hypothetical protein
MAPIIKAVLLCRCGFPSLMHDDALNEFNLLKIFTGMR